MEKFIGDKYSARISAERLKKRPKIKDIHIYSLINGHKEELF